MKKHILLLLMVGLVLLSACGQEKTITGKLLEAAFEETDGLVACVVRTEKGKEISILITDGTLVWSGINDFTMDDFKQSAPLGAEVWVRCERATTKLTSAAGRELTGYRAREIEITGLLTPQVYTLADGTGVDLWQNRFASTYRLADGRELLSVRDPSGPENVHVGGVESWDDLNETAQRNISAYYEEQGLLYDTAQELERAYAAYLASGSDGDFSPYLISQEISPTASNSQMIYFLTVVTMPTYGYRSHQLRLGAAFDRQTGEAIDAWQLFSCAEEEARQRILDLAAVNDAPGLQVRAELAEATDSQLRAEMAAALRPECLVFFPDLLEVDFPEGSLPSQEYGFSLGLEYEDLRDLLHAWAIPEPIEEN